MKCQYIKQKSDAYLDNTLSDVEDMIFKVHLQSCVDCQQYMQQATEIRNALKDLPVPAMRAGFAEHAIKNAAQPQSRQRQYIRTGIGLALAASLSIIAVTGLFNGQQTVTNPVTNNNRLITVSMNQQKNVKLLFDAKDDIENVTISIELSDNLSLAGYSNSKNISWNSQLQKGQNILSLPVVVNEYGNGVLVARLRHAGKDKVFRINIDATQSGSTQNFLNQKSIPLNV